MSRQKATARRIGSTLKVRIGEPVPFSELAHIEDRNALVMELRRRTFGLAQDGDVNGEQHGLHLREARIKGVKHKDDL